MVRFKIEKGVWFKPVEGLPVQAYEKDKVYIYQKSLNDGKYRLVVIEEGPYAFEEITKFLATKGKKLPGGANGWKEYYEVDIADAIELYRKLNVPCPDAKVFEV